MFTDDELKATATIADRKIKDMLGDGGKGLSDLEFIQNLQTLTSLKAAAENNQAEYKEAENDG